jgi:hypothetical protein
MSYLIMACKPNRVFRTQASSVEAAAVAAQVFRERGWVVSVFKEIDCG